MFVRDGTLLVRLGEQAAPFPAATGTALLIAPGAVFGYQPEGWVRVTTLLIDTDYLIEHLYWQHLDVIPDREAARDLATTLYPAPVQVLRLGERQLERLGPILDELVTLTEGDLSPRGYFHAHALLFTVLAAIAPLIHHEAVAVPPLTSRQRAVRVAPPRWREFRPVRREIARTAALMQNDIAKRWSLSELAAHACVSTSQFSRLFKESFGVTPITYLSILRVQEMVRLIRETDLLIGTITDQVGWCRHCGHATLVFRRYMGVTPFEYRHYGPPTATREGPGMGVARAAKSANESAKQPVARRIAVELSTGHML
ncbi:AraC-like DNA-binding protein [Leucobacter luti]|uniref:AraC-like DNA-binding protein n=1 Tax=Leucobacter luti TaxID=340320 RepID=A0A4R6RWZ9_9MICO|nr:AraC family transcriptional regulator [Leucobacter luti]TDP91344.1 AraC-like DNA-binding protein [Leucobacter luti]